MSMSGAPGAPAQKRGTEQPRYGSRGQQILISGFLGGLNNVSDITTLEDSECAVLENFEVDRGGGLVSRPPIIKVAEEPVANERPELLGYYTNNVSITYAVVSCASGTYLWNEALASYTLITTIVGSGCAQFGGLLYVCSADEPGGYWDGATFTVLNDATLGMPRGEQIVLYKSRFWMVSRETASNRTRIFFSRITAAGSSPTSINEWDVVTGDDFFDVSAGDGQWITRLIAGSNELYIFRSRSTYYFKYDVTPLQGRLDLLDAHIGADNRYCVDRYEFSYLVLSNGRLYRFVSYNYYPLNDPRKMEFRQSGPTAGLEVVSAVTIFGRRALVWFGGVIYALDLNQGTWSTWSTTTQFAYGMRVPREEGDLTPDVMYGVTASNTASLFGLYKVVDSATSTQGTEEMTCIVQTKAFDFETPEAWKRMWYWAADVLTARDIRGVALPLQLSSIEASWDDLEALTWDELEGGTWDQMLEESSDVISDRVYPTFTPYRVNVTFRKDMRFRRCSYRVELSTDGTSGTGPVRVISLTVHATRKQGLPQIVQ